MENTRLCSRCNSEKDISHFAVRLEYRDRSYIRGVCRTCYNERTKLKRASYKKQIFDHYGWECACCKESIVEFLTIDHTNNDAPQDRIDRGWKRKLTSKDLYAYIIKLGFPHRFQTLCQNCNLGKMVNDGMCPHNKTWKKSTMQTLLSGNYQEGTRMVPLKQESVVIPVEDRKEQ